MRQSEVYYHDHGLIWRPLWESPEFAGREAEARLVTERVMTVLQEWDQTPYMAGQSCKGVAVDCVRFVSGVLDDLYGSRTDVPRDVQDIAMHDPKGATRTMRRIRRMFPAHHKVTDRIIEPGDAIVVGEAHGGPGHALFVGAEKNTLWQATKKGVQRCGLGLADGWQEIFRIYRFEDKGSWIVTS